MFIVESSEKPSDDGPVSKHKALLISLAVAVVLAAGVLTLAKPGEPFYRGHSLSHWLNEAEVAGSEDARTAVRAIGTNAIPLLVYWITYHPPAFRQKLALFAVKHEHENLFDLLYGQEQTKATIGFQILGTNAAPALPAIVAKIRETPNRYAFNAIWALSSLGPQALPYLTNELAATNWMYRRAVIESITQLALHGGPTNACLAPLCAAMSDVDGRVRRTAYACIERFAPEALTNGPGTAPALPASPLSH